MNVLIFLNLYHNVLETEKNIFQEKYTVPFYTYNFTRIPDSHCMG